MILLAAVQAAPQNGGDFSNAQQPKKLPTGVILVKGAWSSASDSVTPVPEGGRVTNNIYTNEYFGLKYALPSDWTEKYTGPPPSDSGYYVLAQIRPTETFKGATRGGVMIAAQDMFFTLTPARNALELVSYTTGHLNADYNLETPPAQVHIANRSFVRYEYVSPVAELHWFVLATQIRCHTVQFVFTSRDTKLIESLLQEMNTMKLPPEAGLEWGTGGGVAPVCVQGYAKDENVLERVDPVLPERRYNSIPVRIIIDKEGKVKHIHFLSAFPEQEKGITEALWRWRFRPYVRDGQSVEVETGIMFGRTPRRASPALASSTTE